jgi:hypothetical protein
MQEHTNSRVSVVGVSKVFSGMVQRPAKPGGDAAPHDLEGLFPSPHDQLGASAWRHV